MLIFYRTEKKVVLKRYYNHEYGPVCVTADLKSYGGREMVRVSVVYV
jgi:hypothetical protein